MREEKLKGLNREKEGHVSVLLALPALSLGVHWPLDCAVSEEYI